MGPGSRSLRSLVRDDVDFAPEFLIQFQTANFKYDFAFSRRKAPELCKTVRPANRGRRECRVPLHP